MILVIDNYDSFTYNLVQLIGELGASPRVVRNDAIDVDGIRAHAPRGLIVSPGPGRPEDAGVSVEAIRSLSGELPILGVCLGHQAIGIAFGGKVGRVTPLHGKASEILHEGRGLFDGLPSPLRAGRYHSLVIEADHVPREVEVTARTPEGIVMAVEHRNHPTYGVQFHPESILTSMGRALLANFLVGCGEIERAALPSSSATDPKREARS
ncbi:MAG TPA: aminodeoxychorismate/anthranilate synthase component II [Planctomycetota bacterium]|nr:aminodeoxychorismate/anthranilate synthase component II [Planctomycetota bacterium]